MKGFYYVYGSQVVHAHWHTLQADVRSKGIT